MDQKQIERVTNREVLAVMTGTDGAVIWESGQSPVSALCKAWFNGQMPASGYDSLYADQLGIALALFAERLGIRSCYAKRVSQVGLRQLEESGIAVRYEQVIPLVRSSKDESKVCPIEQFLADHPVEEDRWDFLKRKSAEGQSCSIAAHRKNGG